MTKLGLITLVVLAEVIVIGLWYAYFIKFYVWNMLTSNNNATHIDDLMTHVGTAGTTNDDVQLKRTNDIECVFNRQRTTGRSSSATSLDTLRNLDTLEQRGYLSTQRSCSFDYGLLHSQPDKNEDSFNFLLFVRVKYSAGTGYLQGISGKIVKFFFFFSTSNSN